MRKILFAAICVFLLAMPCAIAEQAETIRFMGMDWYIAPEEFETNLGKTDLNFSIKASTHTLSWSTFDGVTKERNWYFEIPQLWLSVKNSRNTDKRIYTLTKVAGYNVDTIEAKFVPSYSLDEMKAGNPYILARASYEIWSTGIPKNLTMADVYTDLLQKLTSLYGEPQGEEIDKDVRYSYIVKHAWWYAKDGSGVALRIRKSALGSNYIEIVYGVADETQYFNDMAAILDGMKQKSIDANSQNTDGL